MTMDWRGTRVLITGAGGFIGSHLVQALQKAKAELCLPDRQADAAQLMAEFRPEIVFHLAAYRNPGREVEHLHPALENIDLTAKLLAAAAQHKLKLRSFVYTGTCEEYGNGKTPFVEEQREIAVSPYSASKIASTHLAQMAYVDWGVPVVVVRPFLTYGPGQKAGMLIPSLIQHCLDGKDFPMTSGQQTRDFIFVDDVVEGLMAAAFQPKAVGQIINLGSGREVKIKDMARLIVKLTGTKAKLKLGSVPERAGETLHFYSSSKKALKLLKWKAKIPLEEGLKRTIEWYREHGVPSAPAPASGSREQALRSEILSKVREFYAEKKRKEAPFTPGRSSVHYAGRVYDDQEMVQGVDAVLDFWLTLGRFGNKFEQNLAKFLGIKNALLVNSGSSANLVAVSTLTSPKLQRPLKPGDEVITPALTFPSTLSPIIQNGLIPVFVDVDVATLNANSGAIEAAIGPKTRAIMLPHTLGNPFDLATVSALAKKHNLYLIEDTCDALGSRYDGKPVGTFGDLATISFYPAHHITMGEGGAVVTNSDELAKIAISYRDWGRDCWCLPGVSNTCGKRFDWELGDLPRGYDHKYIYTHVGYNLKPTDMQAAIGVAQLEKLPSFIESRKRNFKRLYQGLLKYQDILILPQADPRAEPAWFAFPISMRENSRVSRKELVAALEAARIETRPVFSGNILRHPAFRDIARRVPGELKNTDYVMANTFFIGTYPGISAEMSDYVLEVFRRLIGQRAAAAK